jgi:hypothetical protein
LSPILFKLCTECFIKEAFEGFGDFKNFKIGGQIIRHVKYTNKLVLLVKEKKTATRHDS